MPNFSSFFKRKAPNQNFNTANLNAKVKNLVSSIRKLRGILPPQNQTVNAFVNATKTERANMNKAIVNFINKYNKAVEKTNAAAAVVQQQAAAPVVPLPSTPNGALRQANQATQQAAAAAQRVQQQVTQVNKYANMSANNLSLEANKNLSENNKTKLRNAINKKLPTLNKTSRQYDLLVNAMAKLTATGGAPAATQQPSAGLYDQYPLLTRVKNVLNSVQNTEESTGKAQHAILKTAQRPGLRGRAGPYMNKFNWSKLKNDPRLNAAQKKTVNKILVSLQVPARNKFRNRPPLNFNIKNKKFIKANGSVNIAKVNVEVLNRLRKSQRPAAQPSENQNVFYNARQTFEPNNKNLSSQILRQHRQAYGN
jgi:hypothetical protein